MGRGRDGARRLFRIDADRGDWASGDAHGLVRGFPSPAMVVDDGPFAGTLSIAGLSEPEGSDGATIFMVTVTRTGGTDGVVGATWTIEPGAGPGLAEAGDFGSALSGTVEFADGQEQAAIVIVVDGDMTFEPDESFTIALSDPTGGAALGAATAVCTILNDDAAPNHPPTVDQGIADRHSDEDAAILFQIPDDAFQDDEDDMLTYAALRDDDSDLPEWLQFDGATGTFSGTPPQDYHGAVALRVYAFDGGPGSASASFSLVIDPLNDAATFGGGASGTVVEDGLLAASDALTVSDPDGPAEAAFQPVTAAAALYGSFSLLAGGQWSYALDNDHAAVQALNLGETLTDTIAVAAADGTPHAVAITIQGTNDGPQPPVLDLDGVAVGLDYAGSYTEGGAEAAIGSSIHITSFSGTINSAVVLLTDGQVGDRLIFVGTLPPGVGVTGNDSSLQFSGAATAADYEAILAGIRFLNTTDSPTLGGDTQRSITVYVGEDAVAANSNTATATIDVVAVNDVAVISGADTGAAFEDVSFNPTGQLLIEDADANEDRFQVASRTGLYGNFQMSATGAWTYSPGSNQDLQGGQTYTDTFTVYSEDGQTEHDVVITVHGNNDAPQFFVIDANGSVTEDSIFSQDDGQISIFDVDANENGWVSGSFVTAYGTFDISATGAWTYTLNNASPALLSLDAGESVVETHALTSLDGTLVRNINVTVHGATDPVSAPPVLDTPIADLQIDEDTAFSFQVPANTFSDPDSALNYSATLGDGSPLPAWLGFDAGTRTFSGTPPQDYHGTLTLRVTADDYQSSVSDTFDLVITSVNDPAILSADTRNLAETGAALDIGSSGTLTISDPDSPETFVAQAGTVGLYGTFAIGTDGAWTYAAASAHDEFVEGMTYADVFSVAAADGTTTSVTINILGTNDAAILSADTRNLTETNDALDIGSSGTLTIGDPDSPQTFVAQAATAGTYGAFAIDAAGAWTYTAASAHNEFAAGSTYTDSFSVAAADGTTTSVTINILGTNDAPVANDDPALLGIEDAALNFSTQLTGNDTDAEGDTVTIIAVSNAVHGTATLTNGVVTFTPEANYTGTGASFDYTIDDGHGGTATATATLVIPGFNDAPAVSFGTPGDATEQTAFDLKGLIILTDPDADSVFFPVYVTLEVDHGILHLDAGSAGIDEIHGNDTGRVTIIGRFSQIQALLAAGGDSVVTYTDPDDAPASTATLTVTFDDNGQSGSGIRSSTTESVTFDIIAVNDAPTLQSNSGLTLAEGAAATVTAAMLDFDDVEQADGAITYTLTDATNGALRRDGVTLNAGDSFTQADLNAGLVSFLHDGGEAAGAGFGFSVSDGAGGLLTGQSFAITVSPVDDAPVAQADAFTIPESGMIAGGNLFASNGSGADGDPDGGPPLAIAAVNGSGGNVGTQIALVSGALLTVYADGTFDYDPNGAFLSIPTLGSGASNTLGQDSFTYTLAGGNTATVTISLIGLDTDDTLLGTGGTDILSGGIGNDTYHVENAADLVVEMNGAGNDRVIASVSYALAAGSHVETLEAQAGSAAINLTGNEFANSLLGNAGANTLNGGAAADAMAGGAGGDIYFVDNAADVVTEATGAGSDRVLASTSYVLTAGAEIELFSTTAHTGTGAINLTGNAFANTITGNDGANTLNGAGGADTLVGRLGDDFYFVDNGADRVVENAGEGADRVFASLSYTLGAGVSVETFSTTLNTGTTAINLTGNELANAIFGNDGANIIDGKAGADTLVGRLGDDWYYVDNAGDRLIEAAGEGNDRVFASASYTLGAGVSVETFTTTASAGTAAINLTGNELANSITGNDGVNILDGKAGADILVGRLGDDFYYVDNAADRAIEVAGEGNDRVFAGVSYGLAAGASVETLSTTLNTGTAAINLTGNELANTLYGNDGANIVDGKAGADLLVGRLGDDFYYVDNGADRVVEAAGEGNDRVFASASYTLGAGVAVEILSTVSNAGTTAINLTGNELANTLYGNAGANTLDGKAGSDVLVGFAGNDIFAFTAALGATNVDRIVDFAAGDKVALDDAIFAGIGTPGAFNAAAFAIGTAQDGNDRIVYNQTTGQLFYDADGNGSGAAVLFATLQGTPVLGAGDFMVI